MSKLADLIGGISPRKLNKKQRRWIAEQMNMQRKHETKMAFMNWMARDEEAKYFAGVMLGAGTAMAGTVFGELSEAMSEMGYVPIEDTGPEMKDWLWLFMGPSGQVAGTASQWQGLQASAFEGDLGGNIGGIMQIGGAGFSGFCASVLLLKAIFSGTDLGELLQGAGEIIPL